MPIKNQQLRWFLLLNDFMMPTSTNNGSHAHMLIMDHSRISNRFVARLRNSHQPITHTVSVSYQQFNRPAPGCSWGWHPSAQATGSACKFSQPYGVCKCRGCNLPCAWIYLRTWIHRNHLSNSRARRNQRQTWCPFQPLWAPLHGEPCDLKMLKSLLNRVGVDRCRWDNNDVHNSEKWSSCSLFNSGGEKPAIIVREHSASWCLMWSLYRLMGCNQVPSMLHKSEGLLGTNDHLRSSLPSVDLRINYWV